MTRYQSERSGKLRYLPERAISQLLPYITGQSTLRNTQNDYIACNITVINRPMKELHDVNNILSKVYSITHRLRYYDSPSFAQRMFPCKNRNNSNFPPSQWANSGAA